MRKKRGQKVTITVEGAWAKVRGRPLRFYRPVLSGYDAKHNFRRGARPSDDGRERLYEGQYVPIGLLDRLVGVMREDGLKVEVREREHERLDPALVTRDLLPGISLWDHQLDVVKSVLTNPRGIIWCGTGGGKTESFLAAATLFWGHHGWRSLIVVPYKGLAAQTVKRAQTYFGTDIEVGQCGDGRKSLGDITVATASTLSQFADKTKLVKGEEVVVKAGDPVLAEYLREQVDVLLLDEAHHASAESWYRIAMSCNAHRRYGLSGSPFKEDDLADMRVRAACGEVICEIPPSYLANKGHVSRPKVVMLCADGASAPYQTMGWSPDTSPGVEYRRLYDQCIVESDENNRAAVRAAKWMVDRGRTVLILCEIKKHYMRLRELLDEAGLAYEALWGQTPQGIRDDVKRQVADGEIDVLLATRVMGEGEDLRGVNGLVFAEGGKAKTKAVQRIGRGMRRMGGDDGEVWVVDIVSTANSKFLEHGTERCRYYEELEYAVRVVDAWGDDDDGLLPFEDWDADD